MFKLPIQPNKQRKQLNSEQKGRSFDDSLLHTEPNIS